jgi:hypothetical protein
MRATSAVKAYVYGTPTLCVLDDRMLGRSVETRLVNDEYFIGDLRAPVATTPQVAALLTASILISLFISSL